jgi:hypothetical protein
MKFLGIKTWSAPAMKAPIMSQRLSSKKVSQTAIRYCDKKFNGASEWFWKIEYSL